MKKIKLMAAMPALLCVSWSANAQSVDAGDTAWILTSTALVLFMTLPGLAMFYAGLVRARSVLSVLMQCFAICCAVSIAWLVLGYSLSFGESAVPGFVGGLGINDIFDH